MFISRFVAPFNRALVKTNTAVYIVFIILASNIKFLNKPDLDPI